MKNILVTGGAGFLGSHLVDRLLARGDAVFVADDFSTGSIKNLTRHDNLMVIEQDVRKRYLSYRLPPCSQIYNLACPASPVHYQADPVKTLQTNVLGTMHALECAHQWNARLLQASTSEVYGDPLEHPQRESYFGNVNPIGPRACYDEGKRAAETLCSDYRRQYKVDSVIVRIFNTYGPRMGRDDGRVVSSFIAAALAGEPLRLEGNGGGIQTRSFCYVDDTIDGLIRAMDYSEATGPINIGNPTELQIVELAAVIYALCAGGAPNIRFHPGVEDDPQRRRPDIGRAFLQLGWRPQVDLREGLLRTINWFRQNDLPHHSAVAVPA